MTTRTMYDSTTPADIPANAEIVALYPHAWNGDFSKFPHALQVHIDNTGAHADDCHVLDVESGAATVAIAHEWVQSWHLLHPNGLAAVNGHFGRPTLYYSQSLDSGVRSALSGLAYDVWEAHWDGVADGIAGAVGKQYANPKLDGHDYDMSDITDDTWGVETIAPVPAPVTRLAGCLIPYAAGGIVQWHQSREVYSADDGVNWK